ncbi:MAG: aldose epimerase family protein [Hellea sp.]
MKACIRGGKHYSEIMIKSRIFGKLPCSETVTAYDFTTDTGFRATILSYGATLQSLTFPDGTDIVLGFDNLTSYLGEHPYFGAAIGRVANRISDGSFTIDGANYELPKNERPNNLHSGPEGFDRVNWIGEVDGNTLILRHTSPDGHQGFPGELLTEFRFSFEGNTLGLDVQATTNKPCPVNITYHPYFNLTNGGATPCTDHHLQINANFYTHADSAGLPTGEISRAPCSGVYRYNDPRPIKSNDPLDQNFVIKSLYAADDKMVKMAKLSSDVTGHKVIICSTQSCLQAYTGAYIPTMAGKAGLTYGSNHGVALEPQSFPDAINQENFPDNVLRPDEIYTHKISYTFRPGEAQA